MAASSEIIPTICGICAAGCTVDIHLVDGKIERLTPTQNHLHGIICLRGTRVAEIVYAPDRLLYPQRHVGPHGAGVGALYFVAYGMIAPQACYGEHYRHVSDDLDNADLILIWRANPTTDSPPTNLARAKNALRRGARGVVIDHRRSETARAIRAEWQVANVNSLTDPENQDPIDGFPVYKALLCEVKRVIDTK